MSRWFRFYDGALDDPKVQGLPGDLFKIWVNLLCVASRNGGCLPIDTIAFSLRLSEQKIKEAIEKLKDRGLIDFVDEYNLGPHNWESRQFKSDVSNERVKRFRKRQSNGACNVTETPDATPPETEQNTDTELKDSKENLLGDVPSLEAEKAPEKGMKKGTRLPDDWEPISDEFEAFCANGNGFTRDDAIREFQNFTDYWRAKPGAGGVKLDWDATFRVWMRKAINDKREKDTRYQRRTQH